MLALSNRTITMDISSTSVRLLVSNEKQVERWASTPLEPGLIKEGVISDPTVLGAGIKRCMEYSKVKSRKVITSISGLYSIYRRLAVTQPDKGSIQQAIMQEATQAIPVSTDDFYLSWQMATKNEVNQQVFIIAMPKYLVDAEVQALKIGGVDPYVMNLKGMALAKLVSQNEGLIINVEVDTIDIALVVDGVPQIMRTILQNQNASLEERIDQFIQILDHITYFYDTQHSYKPLKPDLPLFLTGQFADNPDLTNIIKNRIPYPIMPLSIPLEYPQNLPINQYAVNIGLALKQASVLQRIENEQQYTNA